MPAVGSSVPYKGRLGDDARRPERRKMGLFCYRRELLGSLS